MFVASPSRLDFAQLSAERQNVCCRDFMHVPIPLPFMDRTAIDLRDALVLTDEKPVMEVIHMLAGEAWWKGIIKSNLETFHGDPLLWD